MEDKGQGGKKKTEEVQVSSSRLCLWYTGTYVQASKENKLVGRNPRVHLKPSNEPAIATKIITQMQ